MKLTEAAIQVSRGMKVLQVAPATYPCRCPLSQGATMKRHYLFALFGILAVLALSTEAHAQEKKRPNILIILSDDQGWGDLSINGNKSLKTPNIDALARRGARFDRFYVQPVC